MTISSSSDDFASTPLQEDLQGDPSLAEPSMVERFWLAQNDQVPRGTLGRALGRSPLSAESRPWFVGALGEVEVAERLRALGTRGEAWRVLHSVPVGRATDVDHVVIGPAGVFTLTTENHPGRNVVVREAAVVVDGEETPYARDSAHDAEQASILLEKALGSPVPVTPLVVILGASKLTIAARPAGVDVVRATRVDHYFRAQTPVYSVDEVREITRAALRPRTWNVRTPAETGPRAGSEALPSQHDLQSWFGRVRAEVGSAKRVQALWVAGAAAVLLAVVVVETPLVVQGLLG